MIGIPIQFSPGPSAADAEVIPYAAEHLRMSDFMRLFCVFAANPRLRPKKNKKTVVDSAANRYHTPLK